MADKRSGPPATPDQVGALAGWFKDFFRQFQLAWRLLFDSEIPWSTKLIPLATMVYLISPVDFVPDPALGLGQLDDLAILLIGMRLFVDVCPPDIVAKHTAALEGKAIEEAWTAVDNEVIDVEPELPIEEDKKTEEETL